MNSPCTAKAASGGANGEPNSLFTVMVLSQLGAPKDHASDADGKNGQKGGSGGQFNTVRPSIPNLGAA